MYLEASEPKGLNTMSHFPLLAFIVCIMTVSSWVGGGGGGGVITLSTNVPIRMIEWDMCLFGRVWYKYPLIFYE